MKTLPHTQTPETKAERAGRMVIFALAEAIHSVKKIPNGHLYALVMGKFSFELYTTCIQKLKQSGLVQESSHLLTWTGPSDWTFDKAMADTAPRVPDLGPEFEDGHDWEGFQGGCKRMGCPDGCRQPRPI